MCALCSLQEREKYNKMVEKMQRDVAEAQQNVYEESLARQRLQMEMDAKDSEIEQLRQKLSLFNVDATSAHSTGSLEESVVEEPTSGEGMNKMFELRQHCENVRLETPTTACECVCMWSQQPSVPSCPSPLPHALMHTYTDTHTEVHIHTQCVCTFRYKGAQTQTLHICFNTSCI